MKILNIARRNSTVLGISVFIMLSVWLGVSWYYAGELESVAFKIDHEEDEFDLEVIALNGNTIELRHIGGSDLWERPGVWGLEWDGGYGQIREIISVDKDSSVRIFASIDGTPAPGTMARTDKYAYPGDPSARGLAYKNVSFESPLGPMGAWFFENVNDTWVISVHGLRGHRSESMRILPTLIDLGFPTLAIDYRNDKGTAEDPSGYHQFGITEWEDLESAARYAIKHGANDLVLYGYSMGGAIVSSFMTRSQLADHTAALILDSPMLDFEQTIDYGGKQRNLPGFITATAKWIAGWRFNIDWNGMDYVQQAANISVPIFLIHGEDDDLVPIITSETLAAERKDIVTYLRLLRTPHGAGWNVHREQYEQSLRKFLASVNK